MSQRWHDITEFKDTNRKIIDYAKKIRADEKIKLDLDNPILNFCYVNYDDNILQKINQGKFKSSPVTTIYETRKDQSKEDIEKRKSILRLLAVANKAHYFLFEDKKVWGTPCFIEYPNFINPQKTNSLYELIYPLYKDCIIVASEWASENKTTQAPENLRNFIRFPVALSQNSMRWLRTSNWKKYKKEKEGHQDSINHFGNMIPPKIDVYNNDELQNYLENSSYSIEITDQFIKYKQKEKICRSLNGTKIMFKNKNRGFYFWPKGWDSEMLKEYIEFCFTAINNNDKTTQKQIPPSVDWI